MNLIVFSVNHVENKILLTNKTFKNIFPEIIDYSNYEFNKNFFTLIKNALLLLNNTSEARISFEKNNEQYSFDIDKIDNNSILFCGKKINKKIDKADDELNNMIRLLADNLPDLLWAKDFDGKYLYANKAICENLLMVDDIKDAIGNNDVFFALKERERYKDNKDWHTFGELCFNSDELVIKDMKPMKFEEYGNIKGKLRYLEVHKAPFFDQEGRLLGTIGSGRDITKEVLSKQELIKKDELLIQQSKMAAIGEMLQNIAHQWRQPLSSISTISTGVIVQKELNILSDEELLLSMERINDTIQYLSKTIDDFRYFFKPQKEKKLFSIKSVVDKLMVLIDAKIRHQSIDLIINIEQITIFGFENEFTQVLINILNNSIDALIDNKIENKIITITAIVKSKSYEIIIKDNAGGIDEKIINKIFDPYFTTKHKEQGTGIGLYMSSEIINNHMKGTLNVKNSSFTHNNHKYVGAMFKIVLFKDSVK